MHIAITTQGNDLDAEVDPRFGRASRFLIVDSETLSFQVVQNAQNLELAQGAGIQAAQNLLTHHPDLVLTGNCGPKAFRVLEAAGMKVVVGVQGKIRQVIQDFLAGKYARAERPNVEGHWV